MLKRWESLSRYANDSKKWCIELIKINSTTMTKIQRVVNKANSHMSLMLKMPTRCTAKIISQPYLKSVISISQTPQSEEKMIKIITTRIWRNILSVSTKVVRSWAISMFKSKTSSRTPSKRKIVWTKPQIKKFESICQEKLKNCQNKQ